MRQVIHEIAAFISGLTSLVFGFKVGKDGGAQVFFSEQLYRYVRIGASE